MGIAEYNGYGFIYCGIYRTPRFWRKSKRKEKIYGKIKNLEEEDLCSQNLHMWAWFPKEKSMCMRCGIVESNHILGSIVNT